MHDNTSSAASKTKPSRGCVNTGLRVFGCAFAGLITGAIVGLFVFPALGWLLLPRDYEIHPWDGQTIGEFVGVLIGLFVALKRFR